MAHDFLKIYSFNKCLLPVYYASTLPDVDSDFKELKIWWWRKTEKDVGNSHSVINGLIGASTIIPSPGSPTSPSPESPFPLHIFSCLYSPYKVPLTLQSPATYCHISSVKIFFKDFFIIIHERQREDRQRHRQKKQAAWCGTWSQDPRIMTWAEGRHNPLSHPGATSVKLLRRERYLYYLQILISYPNFNILQSGWNVFNLLLIKQMIS